MTLFWLAAMAMVVVGLALLLPPLLRAPRAQGVAHELLAVTLFKERRRELDAELTVGTLSKDQYQDACDEMQRDLLENTPVEQAVPQRPGGRWVAPLLGVLLPLLAAGIYLQLGQPNLITLDPAMHGAAGMTQADPMEEVIDSLRARLQSEPEDIEGWVLLGRSMTITGRYGAAAEAFARAYALDDGNAEIIASYADALAMAHDGDFSGRPLALIEQALALEPDLDHALWLAGLAAVQQGEPDAALDYWQRLLAQIPPDDEARAIVQGQIEQLRSHWIQLNRSGPDRRD